MYDHQTQSLWPQLWMGAASGSKTGSYLKQSANTETTWHKWQELHPDTLVLSSQTGYNRNYSSYPYGDYRTNHQNTFRQTTPTPAPLYPNKNMVFGLVDRENNLAKGFVHSDLASKSGVSAVINDSFGSEPIVVVYEQSSQLVMAFYATTPEGVLKFDATEFIP